MPLNIFRLCYAASLWGYHAHVQGCFFFDKVGWLLFFFSVSFIPDTSNPLPRLSLHDMRRSRPVAQSTSLYEEAPNFFAP